LYTGNNASSSEKTRKVYLPKTTWYDFWTGKRLEGGQTLNVSVPMDMMPLYVKAGSIIPMGPDIEYATQKTDKPIELRIYPGSNGSFKFYEDENDNYNYEKGKYATFTLNWDDKAHKLTITDTKGNYPGMKKQHMFSVVIVNDQHGSNSGVTAKADKTVKYEGRALSVQL
jgi:alpha-D-xyloside xylohydrolase